MSTASYYDVLGVPMTASFDEIQSAYKEAMRSFRDQIARGSPAPVEHLEHVRAAYRTLREAPARERYDAELGQQLFARAGDTTGAALPATATGVATGIATATAAVPMALAAAGREYRFEYVGKGGEYFRIWIVNLLLSLVTLGIYSAWAKVRREQYFHRNLLLDGSGFDYHGDPKAILKGRVIAVGVFMVLGLINKLAGEAAYGLAVLALIPVVPWLIVRALRFRAYNTSYRGLRFAFDGGYRQAFVAFVGYGLLTMLTLGLMFPAWLHAQKKFIVDHLRYGSTAFATSVRCRAFYGALAFPMILAVLAVVAFLIALTAAKSAMVWLLVFGVPLLILVILGGRLVMVPYVWVRTTNLLWNSTRLADVRFAATLRVRDMVLLLFGNLLLTVLTLGLYWPWAQIRLAAYRARHLALSLDGELDAFCAGESRKASALGDEAAEMFDFDVAL